MTGREMPDPFPGPSSDEVGDWYLDRHRALMPNAVPEGDRTADYREPAPEAPPKRPLSAPRRRFLGWRFQPGPRRPRSTGEPS